MAGAKIADSAIFLFLGCLADRVFCDLLSGGLHTDSREISLLWLGDLSWFDVSCSGVSIKFPENWFFWITLNAWVGSEIFSAKIARDNHYFLLFQSILSVLINVATVFGRWIVEISSLLSPLSCVSKDHPLSSKESPDTAWPCTPGTRYYCVGVAYSRA
jgi:hypothetical protein